MKTGAKLDEAKRQAFAARMAGVLNGAALALMTSIGRQTGLFEVMARLPSSTSEEIAREAGLQERYVREWLGALVTGGFIEFDADQRRYRLPPEHALVVTDAAGARNMARFAQFVPMLAGVEADVVESFRQGGGVSYSKFHQFQALVGEASGLRFDHLLIDRILPLTGLTENLRQGADVLDLGCGQGHAVNLMASAFPASRFAGYDFSDSGIGAAQAEARRMGNTNANFRVHDVTRLDEPARYDLVTAFDAIHDQADPKGVLREIAGSLKPKGAFLMVDIRASSDLADNMAHPLRPFLYTLSTMHCMTVSLAQNGAGLGAVWGEQKALGMLAEAGFRDVQVHRLPEDPLNNYYVARRG